MAGARDFLVGATMIPRGGLWGVFACFRLAGFRGPLCALVFGFKTPSGTVSSKVEFMFHPLQLALKKATGSDRNQECAKSNQKREQEHKGPAMLS
eukprot:1683308-Amphidinium_carterae.1